MENNKKPVLIVEQSKHLLEAQKNNDNSYILEGIFAEFGVENNNNRIYEAQEYLPHLSYLQEKIKDSRLVGEADHPDKFDISLKNVSHIIEKLEYDEKTQTVTGRVRLLDTDAGRNAQRLIDGGVKLSISSRAAGLVESNKTVKIKKIFTYDLVADPGFASARLNRINESLGLESDTIGIFEMDSEVLKSSKDFDMVSLYSEISTENKKDIYVKENIKNGNEMAQNFVTEEQLNEYSKIIKKDFQALSNRFDELSERELTESENSLGGDIAKLNEKINQVVSYMEEIAKVVNTNEQKLDKSVEFSNYLSENLSNSIEYTERLSETFNNDLEDFKGYANYLREKLENSIDFSNHLSENVNNAINYAENIAEDVENNIKYIEYVGENLNKSINHNNHLVENINNVIAYNEYLSENLNKGIEYTEHLAENMSEIIDYTEYVKEGVENSIGYTEFVAEQTLTRLPQDSRSIEKVSESVDDKIEKLLSLVEKQKINDISSNGTPKYLQMLSESNKARFYSLSSIEKQKVVMALNESNYSTESEVINIWNKSLVPVQESRVWISNMPEEYRQIWENLDESRKAKIEASARMWDLSSQYKVNDFWHRQGLHETVHPDFQKVQALNESVRNADLYKRTNESQNLLGYNQDLIKQILNK